MKYRIITDDQTYTHTVYIVEVKAFLFWHTVKIFHDEDEEYALRCANELLDQLQTDI